MKSIVNLIMNERDNAREARDKAAIERGAAKEIVARAEADVLRLDRVFNEAVDALVKIDPHGTIVDEILRERGPIDTAPAGTHALQRPAGAGGLPTATIRPRRGAR
jgi:hypothetical protein